MGPKSQKKKKSTVDNGISTREGENPESAVVQIQRKARSDNWSKDSILSLINAVSPHYDQLFGKHSSVLDEAKKNMMWNDVTNKVNAVSVCKRDPTAVKKKFIQLKSTTKGIASEMLREKGVTGGGEISLPTMDEIQGLLVELELWQRSLVRMIGIEGLVGIEGGIDGPNLNIAQPSDASTSNFNANNVNEHNAEFQAESEYMNNDGPPHQKKNKLTGIEASERMIEIQFQILEQMKSISSSLSTLVDLARSGSIGNVILMQNP